VAQGGSDALKERLQQPPLFAAEWLQFRNRLRRWAAAPLRFIAVAALGVAALSFLSAFLRHSTHVAVWLTSVQAYWPVVLVIATLYAAVLTGRRRRAAEAQHSKFWLAAAPISAVALTLHRAARSFAPLVLHLLIVSALVLLGAHAAAGAALRVMGLLWGGALLGATIGWFSPAVRSREHREGSRYAPRVRALPPLSASLASLSHWPIAQSFAWGRPENLRALVVVCLLLGVQAGTSALHGLLIVAVWVAGAYLSSLLIAVPRAAQAAAHWLRATPLAFGRFAWALARRALVHQALGVVVLGTGLLALGAPLSMALYLAGMWLSIVALVYAIGAADAYQGRSSAMKLALSFAGIAAIESRFHAWSAPAALIVAAWRLRSARS
jgi:hypothetical protein